jgi:hypothetical protein
MQMEKLTKKIKLYFFLLVVLKCTVVVFSDCNDALDESRFADYPLQSALHVNPDELDIAGIALNYNQGHGFAANLGYYARKDKQLTAWRTSTPVFLHVAAQRLYKGIFPDRTITLSDSDPYFRHYALGVQILSLLLFWASLFAFYELSVLFLGTTRAAFYAVLLYGVMPSVLYYVGSAASYENLALPLLIIVTAAYCRFLSDPGTQVRWQIVIGTALVAAAATLVRPHTTLTFYAYGGFLLLYALLKKYRYQPAFSLKPVLTVVLFHWIFLIAVQIPVFYKNYQLFGQVILSNQAGFNFLLGHNEQARGSWLGDSGVGSTWDRYVAQQIPGIETMNEYQEAQARRQLAIQWIKDNPAKELVLAIRKTAIFFLPDNYLHPQEINPAAVFTAIVHLLFALGGALYLYQLYASGFALQGLRQGLPYVAVLTMLAFSILFFVDHRWRYYADPFMLLIAVKTAMVLGSKWRSRVAVPASSVSH